MMCKFSGGSGIPATVFTAATSSPLLHFGGTAASLSTVTEAGDPPISEPRRNHRAYAIDFIRPEASNARELHA